MHSYASLVRRFGEPTDIVFPEHNPLVPVVHFGDIAFLISYNSDTSVFSGFRPGFFRVYSPGVRFGEHQIGVGSTREMIEYVYGQRNIRVGEFETDTYRGLIVVDCGTWLWFYLDGDDSVIGISITSDGP